MLNQGGDRIMEMSIQRDLSQHHYKAFRRGEGAGERGNEQGRVRGEREGEAQSAWLYTPTWFGGAKNENFRHNLGGGDWLPLKVKLARKRGGDWGSTEVPVLVFNLESLRKRVGKKDRRISRKHGDENIYWSASQTWGGREGVEKKNQESFLHKKTSQIQVKD